MAVRIAKEAACDKTYVAGSVEILGRVIEPYGELPRDAAFQIFKEQIKILLGAGVDAILIETMILLDEALIALEAAKNCGSKITCVSMKFEDGEHGVFTSYGESPRVCADKLKEVGAEIIGSNCGHGFQSRIKFGRKLRETLDIPILIQPNAGLPKVENGKLIYEESIERFEVLVEDLLEVGINYIGGCCGTTPEYIEAANKVLKRVNNKN